MPFDTASTASGCCTAAVISTWAKLGTGWDRQANCPPRSFCRQPYSRPVLMPCLRATSVGVSAGLRLSATISRFYSSVQARRRSPRVMSSTAGLRALVRDVAGASSGGSVGSAENVSMVSMPQHPPQRTHPSQGADAASLTERRIRDI
jgi:hypothetical protein